MVKFIVEAVLQLDGGQSFQDRGAKVKQGGDRMVGCILWGQREPSERRGGQPGDLGGLWSQQGLSTPLTLPGLGHRPTLLLRDPRPGAE